MAEEIKITLGADSSKLTAELQKAENELKQFQAALRKTTDIGEIQKLQTNIKGVETQIVSLKGGMQKLTPASNTATQSLTNLSRVAQDAPFGFIGIANNLNPLFESFGRLRSETGSTGGALKALVGSLAGAGGIGLALGLVTSALQFAAVGFSAWVGKTKEAKEAADETKKALNAIYTEQAKEATQVTSLIAVLNSETETRSRKLDAIKELQKINPDIFKDLKLEKDAVIGADLAYQSYIANIKNVLAVKILQQKLEKELTALVELEGSTQTKSEKKTAKAIQNFNNERLKGLKNLGAEGANYANQIQGVNDALIAEQNAEKNIAINATKARIKELTDNLTELSNAIKINSGALGKDTKDGADKAKKNIETIDSVLAGLRKSLLDAFSIGVALDTPRGEVIKQKIGLVEGAIKKLVTDFNLSADSDIIVGLSTDLRILEEQLKPAKLIVQKQSNELSKRGITVRIQPTFEDKPIDPKSFKTLVDFTEQAQQFLVESFNEIGTLIGETLGNALTGKATIGGFFNDLFKIIGSGLVQLGKYIIGASKLIKTIKETLALKPELALIAGIALVALGSAINAQFSQKQAFAVGTRNAPGGIALVGERGPELINLPKGSQVVPAAQTASMMGGIAGAVEVFGVLRGQDIYFSNKKYGQTYGRTT